MIEGRHKTIRELVRREILCSCLASQILIVLSISSKNQIQSQATTILPNHVNEASSCRLIVIYLHKPGIVLCVARIVTEKRKQNKNRSRYHSSVQKQGPPSSPNPPAPVPAPVTLQVKREKSPSRYLKQEDHSIRYEQGPHDAQTRWGKNHLYNLRRFVKGGIGSMCSQLFRRQVTPVSSGLHFCP